jgi:hypothetical protein
MHLQTTSGTDDLRYERMWRDEVHEIWGNGSFYKRAMELDYLADRSTGWSGRDTRSSETCKDDVYAGRSPLSGKAGGEAKLYSADMGEQTSLCSAWLLTRGSSRSAWARIFIYRWKPYLFFTS